MKSRIPVKDIFEGAGILSIVISLIFVGYQVLQANRIAEASMEIQIRNNFSSQNELMMSDTVLAEIIIKARDPDAKFTEIEDLKYSFYIRRLMNNYLAIEIAYKNKVLSETTYEGMFFEIEGIITGQAGGRKIWKRVAVPGRPDSEISMHIAEVLEELE